MDLLRLAQHRFEQLAPRLVPQMTVETSVAVEQWLRDHVGAVVEPLARSRRFRRLARWSPDSLSPGTDSPQRRLVEAVDRTLVEAARQAATATRDLGLLRVDEVPARSAPTAAEVLDPPGPSTSARPDAPPVIEWLAGRPWFDLACPEEFFTGDRGLHLTTGRTDCSTEFWREADPRAPLGDYVCRAMFARIAYFTRKIDETWRDCFAQAQQHGEAAHALAARLFSAKVRLDQAIDELRQACHAGTEARLRDACTTLVQVYVAYSPAPHLDWLGCPWDPVTAYAAIIRTVVRPPGEVISVLPGGQDRFRVVGRQRANLCRPDVVQGIAAALAVVAEIYRRPVEADELIDWLRQEKRLVLVNRRPRSIYWDGEPIGPDWDRSSALWDLLWKLARRARRRQPVLREELTKPDQDSTRVKVRRSRLSKHIPPALDVLIEAVRPGGYRLILDPEEIALLSLDHEEQLIEVGADVIAPLE
jgi:hypothetical protein